MSNGSTSICQQPVSALRVETTCASTRVSMHSSIIGDEHESRIVTALSFLYSAHNLKAPSSFGAKTTGVAHSLYAGFTTLTASVFSISDLSKSRVSGLAPYSTECIGHILVVSPSTWCLPGEIQPKYSFCTNWHGVSILKNSSLYLDFSSRMTIALRQFVNFVFLKVNVGDFSSVLAVPTTLGSD